MLLEHEDCLCKRSDADGKHSRLTFNATSTTQGLPFYLVERLAAWAVRIAVTEECETDWRHLIRTTIPDPMLAVLDRARREYPEV